MLILLFDVDDLLDHLSNHLLVIIVIILYTNTYTYLYVYVYVLEILNGFLTLKNYYVLIIL